MTKDLARIIEQEQEKITTWLETKASHAMYEPFYSSVDVRFNRFKLAPVDTNLFPAGFNNLSADGLTKASDFVRHIIAARYGTIERILVIAESHSRNYNYFDNLAAIVQILAGASIEVRIGTFSEETVTSGMLYYSDKRIIIEQIRLEPSNKLVTESGWQPDFLLNNNDLTDGIPSLLAAATQKITPPLELGWHSRKKSSHFHYYTLLLNELAEYIGFDPWLMDSYFDKIDDINFKNLHQIEELAGKSEILLKKIQAKYDQYKIKDKPYIYIKANSGTYGMGIMTIDNPAQLFDLNKKLRNKMHKIKGNVQNSSLILQEGVFTGDIISHHGDEVFAEPMVYLLGGKVADCFYRANQDRDNRINLNSSGMFFAPKTTIAINRDIATNSYWRLVELAASLASLASSFEIAEKI